MQSEYKEYNLDIEKHSIVRIPKVSADVKSFPFAISEISIYYAKEKYFVKSWKKTGCLILYTVSGTGELEYLGGTWKLAEGKVAVIDCKQYHSYYTAAYCEKWTFYCAYITGGFCERYYKLIQKNVYALIDIGIDFEFENCFKNAFNYIESAGEIAFCRLSCLADEILTKLAVHVNDMSEVEITASSQYISQTKGLCEAKNVIIDNDGLIWAANNKSPEIRSASSRDPDPWIKLTFPKPKWINRIMLLDRFGNDHTQAAVITFSDGSVVDVPDIKHRLENMVTFVPKNVSWLRINITKARGIIKGSNVNPGFTRIKIYEIDSKEPENGDLPSTPREFMLRQVIEYIHSNYKNKFNVEELSQQFNISKYYLIKLFRKHVGVTPYRYLIIYRINEAKKLLRTTGHTAKDVGCMVGFADNSNFIKTFTRITGVSPHRYRNTK